MKTSSAEGARVLSASKQQSRAEETGNVETNQKRAASVGVERVSHADGDRLMKRNLKRARDIKVRGVTNWWNLVQVIAETHAVLSTLKRLDEFRGFLLEIPISPSHGFAMLHAHGVFQDCPDIKRFDPTALIKLAAAPAEAVVEAKRLAAEGEYVSAQLASEIIARHRTESAMTLRPLKIAHENVPVTLVCHPLRDCSAEQLSELQRALEQVITEFANGAD